MTVPNWHHRAACRNEDPDLFFPIGDTGPALLQAEDAKAVCRRCDVTGRCLAFALETKQDIGIWGGQTPEERSDDAARRKALRKAQAREHARVKAAEVKAAKAAAVMVEVES